MAMRLWSKTEELNRLTFPKISLDFYSNICTNAHVATKNKNKKSLYTSAVLRGQEA
jgi:hypothetical protein